MQGNSKFPNNVLRLCEGRKEKQDKEQASSMALCSVTSARSAGSYGGFQDVPKWGQNRKGDITSAVAFPESILPQEKSRGHARYRRGFREKRGIYQPPDTEPLSSLSSPYQQ